MNEDTFMKRLYVPRLHVLESELNQQKFKHIITSIKWVKSLKRFLFDA